MIPEDRLKEMERVCAAATPEPAEDDDTSCSVCFNAVRVYWDKRDFQEDPICYSCMGDFARKARTLIPELIAECRRLQSTNELLAATNISSYKERVHFRGILKGLIHQ